MALESFLLGNGVSVEVDKYNHYYLKLQSYPQDALVRNYRFEEREGIYIDEFFQVGSDKLRSRVFYRRRTHMVNGVNMNETLVMKTEPGDNSLCPYCYKEAPLEKLEEGMEKFVAYKFRRAEGNASIGDVRAELYRDDVFEPLEYSVVTLRTVLNFDPTVSDLAEMIRSSVVGLKDFLEYPVFTKFMLVLQCSSRYELYEDLYCPADPAREAVPAAVQRALHDTPNLRDNRDYIWAASSQIYQAQCGYFLGYGEAESLARLKALKPTGDDLLLPPPEDDELW